MKLPVKKSHILIMTVLCLIIISANFSSNFDVTQLTEQTVHTPYPKPIGIGTHDRRRQKSDAKTVQDNVDRQHKTTVTTTTPDADVTNDDIINLAKLYEEIDVVETSFDNNFTQFEKSKRLTSSYVTARILGFQREISNCNSSLYQTDELKVDN